MPLYRSLNVSVTLKVAEFGPTIIFTPHHHAKNHKAEEYEAIENIFLSGTPLVERVVAPSGLSGAVNFIGPDEQFPFMMVHAGEDLYRVKHPQYSSAVKKALARLQAVRDCSSLSGLSTVEPPDAGNDGSEFEDGVNCDVDNNEDVPGDGASLSAPKVHFALPIMTIIPERKRGLANTSHKPSLQRQTQQPPGPNIQLITSEDSRKDAEHEMETQPVVMAREFLDKLPLPGDILLTPVGLALVVDLPKSAFSTPYSGSKRATKDIKVEVFLNGELVDCSCHASGRFKGDRLKLLINGRRISRAMSRPWIIIPAAQDAEGHLSQRQFKKTAKAEDRWHAIASALLEEAELRGTDSHGQRPPTGEYLCTLSKMAIPNVFEEMRMTNPTTNSRFGVIDVLITYGTRKQGKETKAWSYEPERFIDPRFHKRDANGNVDGSALQDGAANDADPAIEPTASVPSDKTGLTTDLEMTDNQTVEPPTPTSFIMAPRSAPSSASRSFRVHSGSDLASPLPEPLHGNLPAVPSNLGASHSSSSRTINHSQESTPIKLSLSARKNHTGHAPTTPAPPPSGAPTAAAGPDLTWAPGPLTKDCLVSYALPGPYIRGIAKGGKSIVGGVNADGTPCGVYRPMRSSKAGQFLESEVLAGFRFLIG